MHSAYVMSIKSNAAPWMRVQDGDLYLMATTWDLRKVVKRGHSNSETTRGCFNHIYLVVVMYFCITLIHFSRK